MAITLHGSVAEIVEDQVSVGGYDSPEDFVYEAIESLMKQKINAGIKEGLDDLETGRQDPCY